MNLYAYVGNDPVNMVDPDGKQMMAMDPIGMFVVGLTGALGDDVQDTSIEAAKEMAITAATTTTGAGLGAAGAVKVVRGLSNGAKGKIGEAVARAGIAVRGEKVLAPQGTRAGDIKQLGNINGRGANSKPDYVVQDKSGNVKVVEAKFNSSGLTGAQKDLQKQMGDSFTVSRTTYNDVANAGAAAGAATGAAASCVATASSPCR